MHSWLQLRKQSNHANLCDDDSAQLPEDDESSQPRRTSTVSFVENVHVRHISGSSTAPKGRARSLSSGGGTSMASSLSSIDGSLIEGRKKKFNKWNIVKLKVSAMRYLYFFSLHVLI